MKLRLLDKDSRIGHIERMFGKKKSVKKDHLEGIPFTRIEGKSPTKPLTVFALSTCGFCRRALAFLDDQGIAYRYVHVDKIDRPLQDGIRSYVKETFRTPLSYPFLCIGEDDYLTGFIRASWEKEIADA